MTQLIERNEVLKIILNLPYKNIKYWLPVTELSDKIASLPIQQSNEWIPVTERLPEKDWTYLVVNNENWEAVSSCIFLVRFGWWYDFVTHWQPLLTPPITNN